MRLAEEGAAETAALVWAACRLEPDGAAVAAAVEAGADVDRAARLGVRQRIGPLLHRALAAADCLGQLGPAAAHLLKTDADLRRAQAMVLLPHASAQALAPLTLAGLTPMVFKGPSLAVRYPIAALRPMDDIDLLLPARDHDAALAALQRAGWQIRCVRPGRHYETVLCHPAVPHLCVELHRQLDTWQERSCRLSLAALWQSRVAFDCFGSGAFRPAPDYEVVALAAHAAKPFHQFGRLIWSVDLAVVIKAAGLSLDWDRVAAIARDAGATTALAVGLHQARRLGADAPDEMLRLPAGRARSAVVAPLLDPSWPLIQPDEALQHRLRYALPDRLSHRALLSVGEITDAGPAAAPRRTLHFAGQLIPRLWSYRRRPPPPPGDARMSQR